MIHIRKAEETDRTWCMVNIFIIRHEITELLMSKCCQILKSLVHIYTQRIKWQVMGIIYARHPENRQIEPSH